MSTATMVSPMEFKISDQSRDTLVAFAKKGKGLTMGKDKPELFIMEMEEYKRYRYNEKMEEYEREVEYTKKH